MVKSTKKGRNGPVRIPPKARVYLDLVSKYYGTMSLVEIRKMVPVSRQGYEHWRRSDDFKILEEQARRTAEKSNREKVNEKAKIQVEEALKDLRDLPSQYVKFLETWRLTMEKMQGCEAAGLRLREVNAYRRINPDFDEACTEIEEELTARAKDKLIVKGIKDGDTGAIKRFLEAKDPEFKRRVDVRHTGRVTVTPDTRRNAALNWSAARAAIAPPKNEVQLDQTGQLVQLDQIVSVQSLSDIVEAEIMEEVNEVINDD